MGCNRYIGEILVST